LKSFHRVLRDHRCWGCNMQFMHHELLLKGWDDLSSNCRCKGSQHQGFFFAQAQWLACIATGQLVCYKSLAGPCAPGQAGQQQGSEPHAGLVFMATWVHLVCMLLHSLIPFIQPGQQPFLIRFMVCSAVVCSCMHASCTQKGAEAGMQGLRPMAAAAMPPPQMPVMPMYPQPPPPAPSFAAAGMLAGAAGDPTLGTNKNPMVMTFVSTWQYTT
jgi:hypothetical protein